jgi:hypothetical protein
MDISSIRKIILKVPAVRRMSVKAENLFGRKTMLFNRNFLIPLIAGICVLASACLRPALAIPVRSGPVTWNFIETACSQEGTGNPCSSPPLFTVIGRLNLLDINSQGSYEFQQDGEGSIPTITQTGNPFIFTWGEGGFISAPVPFSFSMCNFPGNSKCEWNIGFTSSALTAPINRHSFIQFRSGLTN